jgi:ABC-2 type transport system ATP-binding protein
MSARIPEETLWSAGPAQGMMANEEETMNTQATQPVAQWLSCEKRYGSQLALQQLNLDLQRGSITALLGPNGAGKSTAIRLILGLSKPSSGSVLLFGNDPTRRRAREQIGVMLQSGQVPDTLKVRELLQLFRSYYAKPLSLAELLELAELREVASQRFATLSGGQKQRTLFATALAGNPALLFLDEPTVGMDVVARRLFWQQIAQLKSQGKTILLTTHYLEEAQALADRVVILDRGRLIADTTPEELRGRFRCKRMVFRCDSLQADVLATHPSIQQWSMAENIWTVLCEEPERLLGWLLQNGQQIAGLEIQGLQLEDAYLALTERGQEAGQLNHVH